MAMLSSGWPATGSRGPGEQNLSLWLARAAALPMALPVAAILALAIVGGPASWADAVAGPLAVLILNTLLLCLGTGALSLLIGTVSAWLIGFYTFPLRRSLTWLAFLPIAMPGYIISFVYVDAFTYAGPLQSWLRQTIGWSRPDDYWFPEVRSLPAAIVIMSLVLYPYVYLAGRAAFLRQPVNQLLVARTLGHRQWQIFLRIVLPQARPALAAGMVLVVMECLNDIGAMSFFGVRTFAIAIYSTWLDQGSLGGAAFLALLMLVAAMALVQFEKWARTRDRLPRTQQAAYGLPRETIGGLAGWAATAVVFLPVLLGFFLPLGLLLAHGLRRVSTLAVTELVSSAWNSAYLAALSAGLALALALTIGYAKRRNDSASLAVTAFLANTGYAIPGTVLAIGVIVPFSLADHGLNHLSRAMFGVAPGLLLSGTLLMLVFAYVARFLISATSMVEAGFERIPRSVDNAARTLGHTPFHSFLTVHLPLLKPAMLAAVLLVFVDAMKELPATLLLRPFDFETLASHVFTAASLGQLEEAALPAIAIVLAGIIPVIVLMRGFATRRARFGKSP
jgi:iron(III) transport system permease protein